MTERILYFDCFSGIAGDMALAALLDLGADEAGLRRALDGLKLPGWRLEVNVERRDGLRGVDVHIWVGDEQEGPAIESDGLGDSHGHDGAHGDHRHYGEIVSIIRTAQLPEAVEAHALSAFEAIAIAEAHVHGVAKEDVHFHEVGAVDSIVDIVGGLVHLESWDYSNRVRALAHGSWLYQMCARKHAFASSGDSRSCPRPQSDRLRISARVGDTHWCCIH